MTNISKIPHDRYDKRIPTHISHGPDLHHNAPVKRLQTSYHISKGIKSHIVDTATKNTNQSIKFEDIRISINTHHKTLSLKLAYYINRQFLEPMAAKNYNFKVEVLTNGVRYHQSEGIFENLETELTGAAERLSKTLLDFAQKKSLDLDNIVIKDSMFAALLDENGDGILQPLGTIIAIIHARGKYKNHPPEVSLYKKQVNGQKNHIPGFEIEKKNPDMQFKIITVPYSATPETEQDIGINPKLTGSGVQLPGYNFLHFIMQKLSPENLITVLRQQLGGLLWTDTVDPYTAKKRTRLSMLLLVIVIIILLVVVIYG
ncbi:MAG TPA: hypothetical protein PLP19_07460 [bacterium]|nr:hypothetical protein [bacterium]HPN43309.1 hypothetical protein [bacterium]